LQKLKYCLSFPRQHPRLSASQVSAVEGAADLKSIKSK